MRTGMIETWAANPMDMGPMYPFAGTEMIMAVMLVAAYVLWQVWQIRNESRKDREIIRKSKSGKPNAWD